MTKTSPLDVRLLRKMTVDPQTQCWLWQGWLDEWGYGRFFCGGTAFGVHRVAYELWRGKIPDGLQIDHLCRVPNCINPDHMEPVTCAENVRRAGPATKTHCKNGHLLDEANTYLRPSGRRTCRSCNRASAAALRARKGGAA